MLMIWFVPESPYYLARKGEHEKAKRSLDKLYGYAAGYEVVSSLALHSLGVRLTPFRNTSTM